MVAKHTYFLPKQDYGCGATQFDICILQALVMEFYCVSAPAAMTLAGARPSFDPGSIPVGLPVCDPTRHLATPRESNLFETMVDLLRSRSPYTRISDSFKSRYWRDVLTSGWSRFLATTALHTNDRAT